MERKMNAHAKTEARSPDTMAIDLADINSS